MKIHTYNLPGRALACCAAALLCSLPVQAAPAKKTTKKPAAAKKTSTPAKKSTPAPKKESKPAPAKEEAQKAPTGIAAHAQFPTFMQHLEKMVKENSTDYYEAVSCVLAATEGDETALNAWMHAAAQAGNAAALRWEISQKLADVKPEELLSASSKEAYQQLVKLADKGYVPAMLDVGACLRMGIGTVKDEAAAQRKLMEACKGGDMKARYQWLMSTKRLSAWEDKNKPEVASEIERGNFYVINHLSSLSPDAATQVEWMKNAAGKGSGDAYLTLSSLASADHPRESMTLLRLAVHLHHPEALFVLASVLADSGTATAFQQQAGITPDAKESLRLMKTAALLGSLRATMALGNAYYDGANGVEQDYKKAYFHFNSPLVSGSPAAATARALLQLQGLGVQQETTKTLAMLGALSQNYAPAAIALAWAHYKGCGTKADAKAAAELLKEAAANGAPMAYIFLAYIYAKGGEGIPEDVAQAKRYVRLASLDMGDKAQQLYDALIVQEWIPHP